MAKKRESERLKRENVSACAVNFLVVVSHHGGHPFTVDALLGPTGVIQSPG